MPTVKEQIVQKLRLKPSYADVGELISDVGDGLQKLEEREDGHLSVRVLAVLMAVRIYTGEPKGEPKETVTSAGAA